MDDLSWSQLRRSSARLQPIIFQLHPLDYPIHLLPEGHFQRGLSKLQTTPLKEDSGVVVLTFVEPDGFLADAGRTESVLSQIYWEHQLVHDLYLEPEWIGNLGELSLNPQPGQPMSQKMSSFLDFEEIPAPFWKAVIAVEDHHFLSHSGVDYRGIARAIWINLKTTSFRQGGSTLTQQLVKNLVGRRSKNLFQKLDEFFLAILLESRIEKDRILEKYLNEVYLGQMGSYEIHGIQQGAYYFFGKTPEQLHLGEIAFLTAIMRGPAYYSPYSHFDRCKLRQKLILDKMAETGHITREEAKAAQELQIQLVPPKKSTVQTAYFTDYVKLECNQLLTEQSVHLKVPTLFEVPGGIKIYTTLQADLNRFGQTLVQQHLSELGKKIRLRSKKSKLTPLVMKGAPAFEGALVAVEPLTGKIQTWIGGVDYFKSNFNRVLQMKRQIGSLFKPFIYLAAFEKGYDPQGVPYAPGHPAWDTALTIVFDQGRQKWSPRNDSHQHVGLVSYRTALAYSINTVAAQLGQEVGLEKLIQVARRLGFQSRVAAVPSLTLGTLEASPLEVVQSYATLAALGVRPTLHAVQLITDAQGELLFEHVDQINPPVFESEVVQLLIHTLKSTFTQGTASQAGRLGWDYPSVGKTGTTTQSRDCWFAGSTPQLTAVVWIGTDRSVSQSSLSAARVALPIWVAWMKQAQKVLEGEGDFTHLSTHSKADWPETDLISLRMDPQTGQAATRTCPAEQTQFEVFRKSALPLQRTCTLPLPKKK